MSLERDNAFVMAFEQCGDIKKLLLHTEIYLVLHTAYINMYWCLLLET